MRVMRLAPIGIAVALAACVAGCTSNEEPFTVPRAAPPQEALLDWVEPTSAKPPRLVFTVRGVTVTPDGWRARVGIRNESEVAWVVGDARRPSSLFGVMLFSTGEMDELERRNSDGELPGIREARTLSPEPPPRLEPGATWEGTISAPGALAAGRWLRVVFGPLFADGETPEGLPSPLLWISDNAHHLTG
jgi:hypothetical protein